MLVEGKAINCLGAMTDFQNALLYSFTWWRKHSQLCGQKPLLNGITEIVSCLIEYSGQSKSISMMSAGYILTLS